MKRYWWNITQL